MMSIHKDEERPGVLTAMAKKTKTIPSMLPGFSQLIPGEEKMLLADWQDCGHS